MPSPSTHQPDGAQSLRETLSEELRREELEREEWALGDYDNGETGCPNCGRSRLCRCPNGKRRCEKCNWCPEDGAYAPSDY